MRIILLALFLASPCIDVLAATCTDMAKIMGYPCTPPPGKGADDAKQDILDLLSDAESMVRPKNASGEGRRRVPPANQRRR